MKQIEENINELILKIKKDENLSNYTFVKGFNPLEHPHPMDTYMIAVSTLDTQTGASFVGESTHDTVVSGLYDLTLKFRVYAKSSDGGDGLLSVALELVNALKRNDTQNICEDAKVSGIAFDNDAMTVYRDVKVNMSFFLLKEVAV